MEKALQDRDRVVVFKVEDRDGKQVVNESVAEARGILISTKEGKAYILPDGMKTIKVWPLDQVGKEPEEKKASVTNLILDMLTFLRGYYTAQKGSEEFRPGQNTKIECVDYLIRQEKGE